MEVYRSPWYNLLGYRACAVKFIDGSKKSVLEHREIMEKHLGRTLDSNLVVHHKDHDKRNNKIGNLEVMTRSEHSKHHGKNKEPELHVFTCPMCDMPAVKLARNVRSNTKRDHAGPFCGRSCAGKYSMGSNGPTMSTLTCTMCKLEFQRRTGVVRGRKKAGIVNPFCSSKCSEKFRKTG